MTICKQCGLDVPQTSKRERVYCDDKCRMAFKRSNSEQVNNEQTNNEQPITNTMTNKVGHCKVCGEKQPSDLIDKCYKCVTIEYNEIKALRTKQGNESLSKPVI